MKVSFYKYKTTSPDTVKVPNGTIIFDERDHQIKLSTTEDAVPSDWEVYGSNADELIKSATTDKYLNIDNDADHLDLSANVLAIKDVVSDNLINFKLTAEGYEDQMFFICDRNEDGDEQGYYAWNGDLTFYTTTIPKINEILDIYEKDSDAGEFKKVEFEYPYECTGYNYSVISHKTSDFIYEEGKTSDDLPFSYKVKRFTCDGNKNEDGYYSWWGYVISTPDPIVGGFYTTTLPSESVTTLDIYKKDETSYVDVGIDYVVSSQSIVDPYVEGNDGLVTAADVKSYIAKNSGSSKNLTFWVKAAEGAEDFITDTTFSIIDSLSDSLDEWSKATNKTVTIYITDKDATTYENPEDGIWVLQGVMNPGEGMYIVPLHAATYDGYFAIGSEDNVPYIVWQHNNSKETSNVSTLKFHVLASKFTEAREKGNFDVEGVADYTEEDYQNWADALHKQVIVTLTDDEGVASQTYYALNSFNKYNSDDSINWSWMSSPLAFGLYNSWNEIAVQIKGTYCAFSLISKQFIEIKNASETNDGILKAYDTKKYIDAAVKATTIEGDDYINVESSDTTKLSANVIKIDETHDTDIVLTCHIIYNGYDVGNMEVSHVPDKDETEYYAWNIDGEIYYTTEIFEVGDTFDTIYEKDSDGNFNAITGYNNTVLSREDYSMVGLADAIDVKSHLSNKVENVNGDDYVKSERNNTDVTLEANILKIDNITSDVVLNCHVMYAGSTIEESIDMVHVPSMDEGGYYAWTMGDKTIYTTRLDYQVEEYFNDVYIKGTDGSFSVDGAYHINILTRTETKGLVDAFDVKSHLNTLSEDVEEIEESVKTCTIDDAKAAVTGKNITVWLPNGRTAYYITDSRSYSETSSKYWYKWNYEGGESFDSVLYTDVIDVKAGDTVDFYTEIDGSVTYQLSLNDVNDLDLPIFDDTVDGLAKSLDVKNHLNTIQSTIDNITPADIKVPAKEFDSYTPNYMLKPYNATTLEEWIGTAFKYFIQGIKIVPIEMPEAEIAATTDVDENGVVTIKFSYYDINKDLSECWDLARLYQVKNYVDPAIDRIAYLENKLFTRSFDVTFDDSDENYLVDGSTVSVSDASSKSIKVIFTNTGDYTSGSSSSTAGFGYGLMIYKYNESTGEWNVTGANIYSAIGTVNRKETATMEYDLSRASSVFTEAGKYKTVVTIHDGSAMQPNPGEVIGTGEMEFTVTA